MMTQHDIDRINYLYVREPQVIRDLERMGLPAAPSDVRRRALDDWSRANNPQRLTWHWFARPGDEDRYLGPASPEIDPDYL